MVLVFVINGIKFSISIELNGIVVISKERTEFHTNFVIPKYELYRTESKIPLFIWVVVKKFGITFGLIMAEQVLNLEIVTCNSV